VIDKPYGFYAHPDKLADGCVIRVSFVCMCACAGQRLRGWRVDDGKEQEWDRCVLWPKKDGARMLQVIWVLHLPL
jgi:hypothetical protein